MESKTKMISSKEAAKAVLKLTREQIEAMASRLIVHDDSGFSEDDTIVALAYPILKEKMMEDFGEDVPDGSVFIPNYFGPKGDLYFDNGMPMILLTKFKLRGYNPQESDAGEDNAVGSCGSIYIPGIMGSYGFTFGSCSKCPHGDYEATKHLEPKDKCMPFHRFVGITALPDSEGVLQPTVVQCKAARSRASYFPKDIMNLTTAIKGNYFGTLIKVTGVQVSKQDETTKKTNKWYVWGFDKAAVIPPAQVLEYRPKLQELKQSLLDYYRLQHENRTTRYSGEGQPGSQPQQLEHRRQAPAGRIEHHNDVDQAPPANHPVNQAPAVDQDEDLPF